MDEHDQADSRGRERGVLPEGAESSQGGARGNIFRTEGKEHRATSLKGIFKAAVATISGGILLTAVGVGFSAFRLGVSTVDERVLKSEPVIEMKKDISDIKGVINGGSDNGMPDRKGLKEMVMQMWYVDNAPDIKPKNKGKK